MSYGSRRLRDYTRASGFVQLVPVLTDVAQWTVFYGLSATNTNFTEAQIEAMTANTTVTDINGLTLTLGPATGQYIVIAIPTYFGNPTQITVDSVVVSFTNQVLQLNQNGTLINYNIFVSPLQ